MVDIEEIKELLKMMDRDKIKGKRDSMMWRTLELIALASDYGREGLLPSVDECARHLKISRKAMTKTLHHFSKGGVVHETPQGWVVDLFQEDADSSDRDEPIRYAYKRHATAAQRRNKGDGAPKQAIPYYD